jgi:hypothetical protein
MNRSTRLIITAAAVAGLYAGSLATRALAADEMKKDDKAGQTAPKNDKAKASCGAHGCAGKNGCAGKGGCKTSDKGCAGKNSCKGKGGCEVKDAKKDDMKKSG